MTRLEKDIDFRLIKLTNGKTAIVDAHRYDALMKFSWRAVQARSSWYAKTTIVKNGKPITICMHRFIARTPFGQVTHHINHNSLDNREANLQNMTKEDHTDRHRLERIQVKFKPTPTARI